MGRILDKINVKVSLVLIPTVVLTLINIRLITRFYVNVKYAYGDHGEVIASKVECIDGDKKEGVVEPPRNPYNTNNDAIQVLIVTSVLPFIIMTTANIISSIKLMILRKTRTKNVNQKGGDKETRFALTTVGLNVSFLYFIHLNSSFVSYQHILNTFITVHIHMTTIYL